MCFLPTTNKNCKDLASRIFYHSQKLDLNLSCITILCQCLMKCSHLKRHFDNLVTSRSYYACNFPTIYIIRNLANLSSFLSKPWEIMTFSKLLLLNALWEDLNLFLCFVDVILWWSLIVSLSWLYSRNPWSVTSQPILQILYPSSFFIF
jgi:hypothetical protein